MLFRNPRPSRSRSRAATAAFVAAAGAALVAGQASSSPGVAVYTAAQADAGRASYQATCAACHSVDLSGNGDAPELAGRAFMESWRTQTTGDLFKYVQGMPPGGPHLATEEYLPIVAYILQQNGAVAGDQPLTAATAATIGAVATADRPAPPKAQQ
jgi:mono/diheme cytochrome c family protein